MIKIDHIPERLAHLPLDDRGYPIPYFVPILNGKPEFRFSDSKKKKTCRTHRKCWICGDKLLARHFWFITGPIGFKNRTVSDEAMHEECARFSLKVCPHMFYEKAERRLDDDIPGAVVVRSPTQALEKPKLFFLIEADKMHFRDEIHTRFRAKKAESYHYINNKLEFLVEGEV